MIDIQQLVTAPKRWALSEALLLSKNNWDDAKDLLQEMLYRAYKSREHFKYGDLDSWLRVILKACYFDRQRSSYYKKNIVDSSWVVETYDDGETRLEMKFRVQEAYGVMTEFQKKIMNRVGKGYQSKEIAAELEYSDQYVKDTIVKARKKIKNLQL